MIVEVRSYRIQPGRRTEFVEYFHAHIVPALHAHAIQMLGPLLDVENPNRFVWLRAFPSRDAYDRMRNAFYAGPEWQAIESVVMSMLESYDVALCERAPGYLCDPSLAQGSEPGDWPRGADQVGADANH
jgi:NIPSNAP